MSACNIPQSVSDQKNAVEKIYGPWTAHNLRLADGVFTMAAGVVGDEVKLRRIVQIVADLSRRPVGDLRVLDLACLEGMYAIEFARRGAQVVGIEGREANLEKARFAARSLSLGNIDFRQDDVRNLNESKYGTFDAVLCLGILYHLDAADAFRFVENISATCRNIAIFDTATSPDAEQSFVWRDKTYWGKSVREHAPNATAEEKRKNLWASLDNPSATHFTK